MSFEDYDFNHREELLDTFNCDMFWVSLMNNSKFVNILMTLIIESGATNIEYNGFIRSSDNVTSPKKNKCNIYLVKDNNLRWSCCVIEWRPKYTESPILIWYDPSQGLDNMSCEFDVLKKDGTILGFKKIIGDIPVFDLKTRYRASQFCARHPAQDIFSQSWCVMFVSVYINNLYNKFAKIDFVKWQTQPLKVWLKCITTRLPPKWLSMLNDPRYAKLFSHCRRVLDKGQYLERIPSIKSSCIKKIIKQYS